jgi:hypothetical protein
VEVGALIEEALAARVDDDAERIVVFLELIPDRKITIRRRVDVPGDRMTARPVAMRSRANRERHV